MNHGLVRGLAKGSRREKANFSGGFELLQLGEVGLILKPDRDLTLVTEWDLHHPYTALRRSYPAAVLCMFAAELTASSVATGDPHPAVFGALRDMLEQASGDPACAVDALGRYLTLLLHETGHAPNIEPPGIDTPESETPPFLCFDPTRGVLRSEPGSATLAQDPFDPTTRHDALWPIRRETVDALADLWSAGDGPGQLVPGRPAAVRGVRFLAAWLIYRVGRRPASLDAFLRVTRG